MIKSLQFAQYLGQSIKDRIFEGLRKSPFSISVDGGSDSFGTEYLALSVRYFDTDKSNQPKTKFLGLLQLTTSFTGETLYNKIMEFLFEGSNSEELKVNFMGFCADHGINMINTKEKNLAARLQKDFPIFLLSMILPMFCFKSDHPRSYSRASLIHHIVNDISVHFRKSPQRKAKLREVQDQLRLKYLEVLKYVKHRWSYFRDRLDRILEIWPALNIYLKENGTESQQKYFSERNKIHLRLLACLLGKLQYYNIFFQGEDLQMNEIIKVLRECLTLFGDLIVKPSDLELNSDVLEKNFKLFMKFYLKRELKICQYIFDG